MSPATSTRPEPSTRRRRRRRRSGAPSVHGGCATCLSAPDNPCRSCAGRRTLALRLYEQQRLSPGEIAEQMNLPDLRVYRLLEEALERREMEELKREGAPYMDNAEVRRLFNEWRARHPVVNTSAALADLVGLDTSHVRRMLGLALTKPIARRGNSYGDVFEVVRFYPGRRLTTIHRDKAAKLVQAMGRAPATVEGL